MPIFRTEDPYVDWVEWAAFIILGGTALGIMLVELLKLVF